MGHYDSSRSGELIYNASKNVTEEDKTRLIVNILKNGCMILYDDDFSLYHAVVSRMRKDGDKRIFEEMSAYKVRCIKVNEHLIDDNIKTQVAKELLANKKE